MQNRKNRFFISPYCSMLIYFSRHGDPVFLGVPIHEPRHLARRQVNGLRFVGIRSITLFTHSKSSCAARFMSRLVKTPAPATIRKDRVKIVNLPVALRRRLQRVSRIDNRRSRP